MYSYIFVIYFVPLLQNLNCLSYPEFGCSWLAKGALRWSSLVLFIQQQFSLPESGHTVRNFFFLDIRQWDPGMRKRRRQSGLSYSYGVSCHGDAFNERSLSRCTQSVTTFCIQQWLPLLLLVAAWQLTSDAPCSSWSLFNKLGPPISSQPSGLTLRLPAPLGWPWCHLHVGVPKGPSHRVHLSKTLAHPPPPFPLAWMSSREGFFFLL